MSTTIEPEWSAAIGPARAGGTVGMVIGSPMPAPALPVSKLASSTTTSTAGQACRRSQSTVAAASSASGTSPSSSSRLASRKEENSESRTSQVYGMISETLMPCHICASGTYSDLPTRIPVPSDRIVQPAQNRASSRAVGRRQQSTRPHSASRSSTRP
ncbi:MAG: hypothetical protein ACRDNF_16800 [Streptosporangiaceae bacterium]